MDKCIKSFFYFYFAFIYLVHEECWRVCQKCHHYAAKWNKAWSIVHGRDSFYENLGLVFKPCRDASLWTGSWRKRGESLSVWTEYQNIGIQNIFHHSTWSRPVDVHVEWGRMFQIALHRCRLCLSFPDSMFARLDEFRSFNQYIIIINRLIIIIII